MVGGWRLAVGGGWRLAAVGGWWRLAVGGWRLAVGGWSSDDPRGLSLRAVLNKKNLGSSGRPCGAPPPPRPKRRSQIH